MTTPAADLALKVPGATDTVVGVDEATRANRRFLVTELPIPAAAEARIETLELAQGSGITPFATLALLTAYTAGDIPLAWVTNDDVDPEANNGTYRWDAGTTAWVKAADRVSELEADVAQLEPLVGGLRQDALADPYFSVADEEGYAKFTATLDGGFGSDNVRINADSIINDEIEIVEEAARFAVRDPHGYFAVYVSPVDALYPGGGGPGASVTASAYDHIPTPRVVCFAHRGFTRNGLAPENSVAAIDYAARCGFLELETDVRKTSDGEFVMMHDASINRTMRNTDYTEIVGTVYVKDVTLAALRAGYVLESTDQRFRQPVPTLVEFLTACRAYGLKPNIELKATEADSGVLTNADILAVFTTARNILGDSGFAVSSFSAPFLDYVRTLSSEVFLWYTNPPKTIAELAAQKPCGQCWYPYLPDAATVAEAKAAGVLVMGQDVLDQSFDSQVRAGADAIMSNDSAPLPSGRAAVFRADSGSDFAAFTTTGSLSDGVVTLASGQTMTLQHGIGSVDLGAMYATIRFKGDMTVAANSLAESVSNAAAAPDQYSVQILLATETPSLTITGGASGCTIHQVNVSIGSN